MKRYSVWLHNIRSVYNVASIFRTADAAGVEKIYLSGYTPAPVDRFGRKRKDFAKVALGAEESIAWEFLPDPFSFMKEARERGVFLIGVEQDARAENLLSYSPPEGREVVLALGEEVAGMTEEQRKLCDVLLEIPMYGKKESLNVSVAFGVAVYCLLKKS